MLRNAGTLNSINSGLWTTVIREDLHKQLEVKMKSAEKKMLLKHIKKDDKEFRDQIKDDVKLKKKIITASKEKK